MNADEDYMKALDRAWRKAKREKRDLDELPRRQLFNVGFELGFVSGFDQGISTGVNMADLESLDDD